MTTSESKGRFFLQNESIRIDSHNESNRELECSTVCTTASASHTWTLSPRCDIRQPKLAFI